MRLSWERHVVANGGRRKHHSATLLGDKIYIFGGYSTTNAMNLNNISVVEATANGFVEYELEMPEPDKHTSMPRPRNGHRANLVGDRLFAFGGWGGTEVFTDVCIFDFVLRRWSIPKTYGESHPMLNMHVSEYVEWKNCILCYGGGDGQVFESGTYSFNTETLTWKRLKSKGQDPEERANASSCLVSTTFYVYGGWNRSHRFDDIHLLELPKNKQKPFWTAPNVDPRPVARVGAGLASFYGNIVMYGGMCSVFLADVHVFNTKSQQWRKSRQAYVPEGRSDDGEIEIIGSYPVARMGHTATPMADGSILIYGGNGRYGTLSGSLFTLHRL